MVQDQPSLLMKTQSLTRIQLMRKTKNSTLYIEDMPNIPEIVCGDSWSNFLHSLLNLVTCIGFNASVDLAISENI